MNPSLSVLCIYICITICSTSAEKLKSDKMSEKSEKTSSSNKYRTFERKEDIPEDYLQELIDMYDITEDPAGDHERAMKEIKKDYPSYYDDNYDTYTTAIEGDSDQQGIYITESEEINDDNSTSTSETNGTCKTCEMREQEKQMRLEQIKSTILGKLRFSSDNLPNVTKKTLPNIPTIQRLIDARQMQADAPYSSENNYIPEDDIYGQVKRAYTISQPAPESFGINVPGGTYFELPESVTSRKIQDSTLWIYLKPDLDKSANNRKKDSQKERHKKKEIYEIYLYIVQPKTKPQHILKSPKRYKKTSSTGWIEFKLAHFVHHWAKQPAANRGIIIQAYDSNGRNVAITPDDIGEETHFPMLEMWTVEHDDDHHRSKRYVNNVCSETERIETCCRYPLRVDFVQFGWDWVIAPTGYDANYCSGECRYRHLENNPQAYLIQQAPAGSGPCCTPSKFFPLAMLYFDHQHTVLYTFMQKMVVDRCGCA